MVKHIEEGCVQTLPETIPWFAPWYSSGCCFCPRYGRGTCFPPNRRTDTAASSEIPPPLLRQLKPGGRMCIPVGTVHVLEGPSLRSLPGLSLNYEGEIPGGKMLFLDGDPVRLRIPARKVMDGPLDFLSRRIQSVSHSVLR